MSLSRETRNRIDHFRRYEELYQPNDHVKRLIGSRTLHMVIAPAVMGKSLVMNRVATLDERFGRSTTLSTRTPRDDDEPGAFRLVAHSDDNIDALLDKILSGELVQYKFHPTEHTFYGSEATDHPYAHNMLPTLSGAINQLQHVGFKDTSVVGLVAPPASWQARFNDRYPEHHPGRLKRLKEAEISYNDLLVRNDVTWLINRDGDVDGTAQKLINLDGTEDETEALDYVHHILQLAHDARRRTQSKKHE